VLLAADGVGTNEIVRRTGLSKPTVIFWKRRYATEGAGGLKDRLYQPGPVWCPGFQQIPPGRAVRDRHAAD
jgi:transposase